MTEIKLKPCPFCGSKEVAVRYKEYTGRCDSIFGKKYAYCECLDCDAQTGDSFDDDAAIDMFSSGKERAVFMWNLRADKD